MFICKINFLFLFLIYIPVVFSALFSVTTGVVLSTGAYVSKKLYCNIYECCNDKWIRPPDRGLKAHLKSRVFGQPQIVAASNLISGFVNSKDPSKPLVISIHGPSGTGKNYFSSLVADYLFTKGGESQYVKVIVGSHFVSNNQFDFEVLRDKVIKEISSTVSQCNTRSLIIIDEVDKFPPKVLESIKSFFDFYNSVEGVDYRHTIFILISNVGQEKIANLALDYAQKGKNCDSIPVMETEKILRTFLYSNDGKVSGFLQSPLISASLVDQFIAFFPLEAQHVKECIKYEARMNSVLDIDGCVSTVIKMIEFVPPNSSYFSASGCKKIRSFVTGFC